MPPPARLPVSRRKLKNPAGEISRRGFCTLCRKRRRAVRLIRKRLGLSSEAVAAIYRAVAAGLKGDFAGVPAPGANRVKHRTRRARMVIALACVPACFAALRFVYKTFFRIKRLFAGSEIEFLPAVLTVESLVVVHEIPLSIDCTLKNALVHHTAPRVKSQQKFNISVYHHEIFNGEL
jgi:hypothetical protein